MIPETWSEDRWEKHWDEVALASALRRLPRMPHVSLAEARYLRTVYRTQGYVGYLRTDYWRLTRALVMLRDSDDTGRPHCMTCGSYEALEVHHNSYDRFPGYERLDDLITLCARCHRKQHLPPPPAWPLAVAA